MADRKLNLNISADTTKFKADLTELSSQIGKLASVSATFAESFNGALAKAAIAQERLNAAAGQTLIIEERLSQAAIRKAAEQVKADNAAIAGKEKLNQVAAQTLIAEERASKAATDRLIAEQRLEQQAARFAQQQSDRAKKTEEQLKRTAAAAEQASKAQSEGAGGLLKGLQSNLFALNNLRFGIESFAFIAQSSFSTILGQAITLENQILSLTGSFASLNTVKLGGQEITNITEKINAIEPVVKAAITQVREISLSISGVTSSQLVDVFQTIAQNSAQANLSIKDSVGLVKSFSAGIVSANIPIAQQRQEVQSILTAQINQDSTLAKQLGITNELVKRFSSQGKLVEFLNERLKGSVEIQKRFSETLTGSLSNLQELGENLQQAFGAVLLRPLTAAANELYNFLLANKSQIEGFFVSVAVGIVGIGTKLKEVFDASLPLLRQIGGVFSTVAGTITGVLLTGLNAFVDTTKIFVNIISAVLTPILGVLNSDLGKIGVTASVLVTILNAALLPAVGNVLNFLFLTASGIVAAIGKIAALIVAYSAETASVTTLSGAYAQLTAAKILAQGGSAGLGAITAALSGGLVTLALVATAATAALFFYAGQLKEANDEAEALRINTDGNASDSLRLIKSLKGIQDQRKINGQLSEEEQRKEQGYIDLSKKQVAENNKLIASLRARANADSSQKDQLEAQIKLIEQLNGQLSQLQTDGLAVTKIGAAYTFLAEQAANAIKDIKAGVNEVKFDAKNKELLDITAQQLEANLISRKQAVEQLNFVALNENSKVEVRLKAQKQVLKLLEEQGKEEIGLLKAQGDEVLSLVSDGQISEIEGIKKSGELKKQQLDLQLQNLNDFYKQQQEFVAKNETATIKTLQENIAKAQQASAEARTSGNQVDIANTAKAETAAKDQLLLAEKNFQNQKLILSQEFQAKDLTLKTESKKAERESIQQQITILRGALDRELSANADLRKKAEFATQADILALKLGGYESEKQLEEQSLLIKKQTIESEIADKRRVIEFDKTALTNTKLSQKEREELILKIGNQEAELAKLNLDATDNLIARTKILYDRKIQGIEKEKATLDKVSKLLESQNDLQKAQIDLVKTLQEAELKVGETRLSSLKEAGGLLKDLKNQDLDDESRKYKEEEANNQKRILSKQRLIELGFNVGSSELDIARQIFDQEQKNLELKARQFEQNQIAEQRSLKIQQQQNEIKNSNLVLDAKAALFRAKESGNEQLIRDAFELVNLTEQQVANNQQIGDLQTKNLAVKQQADREAFNYSQGEQLYKAKTQGADNGLKANELINRGNTQSIKAGAFIAADIPTTESAKGILKANQDNDVKTAQQQRTELLGAVANGAVAFEDTTDKVAQNFASLPESLKATKAGLQEVISQAKELGDNPIFKSRDEQQKRIADENKQNERANITNRLDGGYIEVKSGADAQPLIEKERARREQAAQDDANYRATQSLRNGRDEVQYSRAAKEYDKAAMETGGTFAGTAGVEAFSDQTEAVKRRRTKGRGTILARFTGGLTPADIPVTVNEQGQEAITNLQTLETSLLPHGERTVQFDAPVWVHNAVETRQIRNLGMLDDVAMPDIAFAAIGGALRIGNAEMLNELRLQNSLLSQLADGIKKPNITNNFSNDPRPDLTIYRLQNQLLRN